MKKDSESGAQIESLIEEYITNEAAPNPDLLPIGRDTKLIESGILDSLSILKLVAFLEERFDVKVAPEDIVQENFETIGAISRYISERKGA
jgi:acyl carrier protein